MKSYLSIVPILHYNVNPITNRCVKAILIPSIIKAISIPLIIKAILIPLIIKALDEPSFEGGGRL